MRDRALEIKEIDFTDIAKESDALEDFYVLKRDGFVIKNVLNDDEVEVLRNKAAEVGGRDMAAHVKECFTYPTVFQEYVLRFQDLPTEEFKQKEKFYFEYCRDFGKNLEKEVNMDVQGKVEHILSTLGNHRPVKMVALNENGHLPFGTFRYFNTDFGSICIHCGNFFQSFFNDFFAPLKDEINFTNQMSYFFVLQKPTAGGELQVFDFEWEDGQDKPDNGDDKEIILKDGSSYFIDDDENAHYVDLSPEPGDMVVFQGGALWHRVKKVLGNNPRITFGGFFSFSRDMSSIHVWS